MITVIGATGNQGGGVAQALLADGEFAVRAVTRDAGSAKARDLAGLGAEVVEAGLTDEDSLRSAFAGAYGAFAAPAVDGGALDHFAGPLHYCGVGLAGEETARDLELVRAAGPAITRARPRFSVGGPGRRGD